MQASATPIDGLLVLQPKVFTDERGYFYESFNPTVFNTAVGNNPETGKPYAFVQDNHSHSSAGVLRGLHYQLPPFAQGKLVRVVRGRVWDVTVDMRKTSATFGKWFGLELSAANKTQVWIPPGFAHGFIALEDGTEFLYKTTAQYDKASEAAVLWNDVDLAIAWPSVDKVVVNEKDATAPSFKLARTF
jgi:dTDP-4-dehydrorhamnose 3,5-epimerase